jgi:hypothetical protein
MHNRTIAILPPPLEPAPRPQSAIRAFLHPTSVPVVVTGFVAIRVLALSEWDPQVAFVLAQHLNVKFMFLSTAIALTPFCAVLLFTFAASKTHASMDTLVPLVTLTPWLAWPLTIVSLLFIAYTLPWLFGLVLFIAWILLVVASVAAHTSLGRRYSNMSVRPPFIFLLKSAAFALTGFAGVLALFGNTPLMPRGSVLLESSPPDGNIALREGYIVNIDSNSIVILDVNSKRLEVWPVARSSQLSYCRKRGDDVTTLAERFEVDIFGSLSLQDGYVFCDQVTTGLPNN